MREKKKTANPVDCVPKMELVIVVFYSNSNEAHICLSKSINRYSTRSNDKMIQSDSLLVF